MLSLQDISAPYPEFLRKYSQHLLREYLQVKILEIIFNTPLATKLSFLGGTALRLMYGNTRFSEDLDFDHFGLSLDDFDALAKKVQTGLEENGFQTRIRMVSKGAYRCHVQFPSFLFFSKTFSAFQRKYPDSHRQRIPRFPLSAGSKKNSINLTF